MGSLSGVYEGRIVTVGDGNATAFIPQVFGDTTITISNFLVDPLPGKGWVAFQSGDSEHPVWLSGSSGGTGASIWTGTQAEYDAIVTKDPNMVYVVI